MKIQPVSRKTLADIIAGKLAASIFDETLPAGSQLPAERDLIQKLEVSRTTLREALKILEEQNIIESRAGVGWFVKSIDEANFPGIYEYASLEKETRDKTEGILVKGSPGGPKRLPTAPEKPIHIPNLRTDRLGTFNFISWWEREKVQQARVLVVGAGALGNEVVKNLALMGVGYLYIVDFDVIEAANLSRSPLFRESDNGRRKAEVVAARAKEINPDIHVQYLHGDVATQLGLGVARRMDVIIGCLDNREARLAVNRFANWMNKPWVDGAIQELLGLVRVFVPGEGACFECTLTEQARRDLATRYSCPLLARQNIVLGKVPTTPTIASIIGAMQSQEALKLIHGLPVEAGSVIHFNGMTNHMHTTAYMARPECESHWNFGEIIELPMRASSTTFEELLRFARADLGHEAVIEMDQEIILALTCPKCQKIEKVIKPISEVTFESAHCPTCGTLRETEMTHLITGEEAFLHLPLSELGIPPLHILRAYNTEEYRFYELTGDLQEALHFNDFDRSAPTRAEIIRERIRIGATITAEDPESGSTRGKIVLRE